MKRRCTAASRERSTARFKVLFEGATEKAIGDHVAAVLESVYWRIGKTLNTYPSETLTVILYTNRQFQDITRAPAWAGGGYDGRIRLPVGGALRSPKTLERVVTHEFVHAVIHDAAPDGCPTWVNEGLASYMESPDRTWVAQRPAPRRRPDPDRGSRRRVRSVRRRHRARRLCGESRRRTAAVRRLGSNLGPFLQMLGNGHTVDQALSTHNVQPEPFYAEWQRRIGTK